MVPTEPVQHVAGAGSSNIQVEVSEKFGVPHFGVLMIRIQLFRVLY